MKPASCFFALLGVLVLCVAFLAQAPSPPETASPPQSSERKAPEVSGTSNAIHGRRGVYLTAYVAADPAIVAQVLEQSRKFGLNAVVLDVKNNNGEVCYASAVPLAKTVGAVRPILDLPQLVDELHKNGLYVIARVVVFYDPVLAKHLGNPGTPWVLPTNATAISYNLAIAKEIESFGVDEIQFDYIRFPDDGPIGSDYSERCAAVEAFLAQAREAVSIPISADVYGRVMWPWNAQKIDPIGQQLEGIARHVHVLSLIHI